MGIDQCIYSVLPCYQSKDIKIKKHLSSEIYEPSDDSYLLSNILAREIPNLLKKDKDTKLLEIGAGSGINLQAAEKAGIKKSNILGTDINPEAVKHCKKLGFHCLRSDLFKKIRGKYSVIAFNPPYLPLDRREPKRSRLATTGGKKGNEITVTFLRQAKKHLAKEGKIFLVGSSLSKKIEFKKLGFKAKELAHKKMFFEDIFLWELE